MQTREGAAHLPGAEETGVGTLYLCATPIGNLEDITLRVLRVLREVHVVAAEDTRRTKALLNHFGIQRPVTSLHRFNEETKGEQLCRRLLEGQSVAVVSDAGTPGISDPGSRLVTMALERSIPVTALPGPSALLAALSLSGLDTRRFAFEGFPPRQAKARRRLLEALASEPRTVVFFEAPHRILSLVADLLELWGNRRCTLARELTKIHEEVIRGTLQELYDELRAEPRRGEMVLVVEGRGASADMGEDGPWEQAYPPSRKRDPRGEEAGPAGPAPGDGGALREYVLAEMAAGLSKKEAVAAVARKLGLSRREVYQAALSIPGRPGEEASGSRPRKEPPVEA